ncbi:MAG: hypothetical protein ICV73_20575 [Acetobacteraceae bacterium]|nr:hypothetical protein [Acetobacteraceae bacterium]
MPRSASLLGLAALAALAAAATSADAAPLGALRAAPQYLTGGGPKPPPDPTCPQCGVSGQFRPGGSVMLNPQPLPPRELGARHLSRR